MGQPSAAGLTPHCAGAARPRRSHSEPGSPSPPTASVKFSGAALFAACGPAMSCPTRQFLPRRCPSPLCPPDTFPPTQKDPAQRRGLFYSDKSRISCASAGSRWERDRTRSSHKAGELPRCRRSHRVSGRCPLPRSAAGYFPPTQKDPARWRGLFLFRQEPDQLRFCRQSMVKG